MPFSVPPSLLFEYAISISRLPKAPAGPVVIPDSVPPLPVLSAMDETRTFAAVRLAWHPDGFAVRVFVGGHTMPVTGSSDFLAQGRSAGDVIHVWLNTRPGTDARRATRHCHAFSLLPSDESSKGKPTIISRSIAQQRDAGSAFDESRCPVAANVSESGYDLTAWIPGSQLTGYREVQDSRRLGFYCVVEDSELGVQPLIASERFPFASDPSLWLTLELAE